MNSFILSPNMQYIPKSWGYERIIVNNELYCGKYLWVAQGHRGSFHYHKIKKETFAVQFGKILLLKSVYVGELEKDKAKVTSAILYAETNCLKSYGIYHAGLGINYDILSKGDVIDINPGCAHQIIAYEDSMVLEISTHSDDIDSYRIVLGG